MIPKALALIILATIPVSAEPFIVAHRGASVDAPENTLPAFKLAWLQGADAIEGDFHLTSDGHIVCHHDPDTRKRGQRKVVIAESTLEELRALDVGAWKGRQWKGTRIPTLSEVLDTVPEKGEFFLEVKCGPEIVRTLLWDLDNHAIAEDQVTIISFQEDVIAALKKTRPTLRANLLRNFKNRLGRTTPTPAAVLKDLAACKADGLGTNVWPVVDKNFIKELHKLGCSHHIWTVDDAAVARLFLDLGSASITTNRPEALREELKR